MTTRIPLAFRIQSNFAQLRHPERVNRKLDGRNALIEAAFSDFEGRANASFPTITKLSTGFAFLDSAAPLTGLVITGTNFIGEAVKATGVSGTTAVAGSILWTAKLPGAQTITITITDDGSALAVTDNLDGSIDIVHGAGGGGVGGAATTAETIAAVAAHATAKFKVVGTIDTAGTTSDDEVTLTGGVGSLLTLSIGGTAVNGNTAGVGITSVTDTAITLDFDASLETTETLVLVALRCDGVLVAPVALIVDHPTVDVGAATVSPDSLDASGYIMFEEDFLQGAGSTARLPGAKDLNNSTTADFVANAVGGVYKILHSGASEAQAGQYTWGNQLMLNPAAGLIFEARFRINFAGATFSADQRLVVGLCSAHVNSEDSLDAVVGNLWFRIEGASLNIYIEGDDGTTDTNDTDSAIDIVDNAYITVKIDCTDLSAVVFSIDGVEVATTISVPLLSVSTPLQPIFCMQRDAGTEAEALDIDWYRVYSAR